MTNRFYRPDDQRAAQVQELFATIARRYDLLNDVMSAGLHRHWKQRLVKLASVGRLENFRSGAAPKAFGAADNKPVVLDLCCGTGDIAFRLARDELLPGRVVGVDFTAEMLRVAAMRCNRAPARGGDGPRAGSRLQFVQADALRLPFADNSLAAVTVGYGLRNLADLEAGLREIRRVLRPGGRLVSLDFGKPESALWRKLYFAHLRFWVPTLGWLLAGDRQAYAYILPSLENYPGQRGVQAAMTQCGFVECGFEEFVGGAMAINCGTKPQ